MWFLLLLIVAAIVSLIIWEYNSHTSLEKLRSLLAKQKWKEANIQTSSIIFYTIARTVRGRIAFPGEWNRAIYNTLRPITKFFGFHGLWSLISWLTLDTSYSLEREELDKFPCSILSEIDRLWRTNTNGHFGFSVQMKIYEDYNLANIFGVGIIHSNQFIPFKSVDITFPADSPDRSVCLLIDKLGWSKDTNQYRGYSSEFRFIEDFYYSLQAPKGHLPFLFYYDGGQSFSRNVNYVQMREMAPIWNRLKVCGVNK